MNNQTHLSNKPPFQKMVARHLCQKFNSQNEISNDVFEVYQYPLLKTQNHNSSGSEDKYLLTMNYRVDKQKYLRLGMCVDKPLDCSYCTQDILEILLKQGKGLIQIYSPYVDVFLPKEKLKILDFKPIWLIRRSLS